MGRLPFTKARLNSLRLRICKRGRRPNMSSASGNSFRLQHPARQTADEKFVCMFLWQPEKHTNGVLQYIEKLVKLGAIVPGVCGLFCVTIYVEGRLNVVPLAAWPDTFSDLVSIIGIH